MKKAETDFFRALKAYIVARDRLKATREIVLEEGFSHTALKVYAAFVADAYDCYWHATREGGISFCDNPAEPKATRRHDACKYWRRTILGLNQ